MIRTLLSKGAKGWDAEQWHKETSSMRASPEELHTELHILLAKIKRYENLHLENVIPVWGAVSPTARPPARE